jgi:DNA-binding NtrC family response regulator
LILVLEGVDLSYSIQTKETLLAIIELGGYPDFSSLYRRLGYHLIVVNSMRKALNYLKKNSPTVIVAEFNYQSAFRDRLSSLESLIAVVQRRPDTKVIVFYEKDYRHQFERLWAQYDFFDTLSYPIDAEYLEAVLRRAKH